MDFGIAHFRVSVGDLGEKMQGDVPEYFTLLLYALCTMILFLRHTERVSFMLL